MRQTVPILIGLTGILILLLTQGYLHARTRIMATTHAQVAQLKGSIVRQDEYGRHWLERSMQPLAALTTTLLDTDSARRAAIDARIVTLLSDEHGRQIVEVHAPEPDGTVSLRRYDSSGLRYAGTSTGSTWSATRIAHTREPVWEAPTMDSQRNLVLRYAVPLTSPHSPAPIGICRISLEIPSFTQRVLSSSYFRDGIAFLLSDNGTWTLPPEADTRLDWLKRHILSAHTGETDIHWQERSYTAVYMPLAGGSLYLGVLIPREQLFGRLDRLTRVLGAIGLAILLLAAYSLHRTTATLLAPFRSLRQLSARLARGEFDTPPLTPENPVPPSFPDEAQRLRRATEELRLALHQRVRDLTLIGQTRERLFGELALARQLQDALRTRTLAPNPAVEIASFVHTAANVCGDMYDCFYPSAHQLCCIMGNVVERGVPAALLTGRVIPVLHELLLSGVSPGKALENVNRMLAPPMSRERAMVSVLAGILDLRDGHFRWACAGQLPPFSSLGGQVAQLPWTGNVPLGIRPHEHYAEQETCLRHGELLFFAGQRLFSCVDATGLPYDEEALQEFLRTRTDELSDLLEQLFARICRHVGGLPADDLIFFAMRWRDLRASAPASR